MFLNSVIVLVYYHVSFKMFELLHSQDHLKTNLLNREPNIKDYQY